MPKSIQTRCGHGVCNKGRGDVIEHVVKPKYSPIRTYWGYQLSDKHIGIPNLSCSLNQCDVLNTLGMHSISHIPVLEYCYVNAGV